MSFLPHLSQLTSLDFRAARTYMMTNPPSIWPVDPAPILAAFHCPLLTRLKLEAPFKSAEMAVLLGRLPRLSSLTLSHMLQLESLAFLSESVAAQRTLQHLSIDGRRLADLLQPHELVHLAALQALVSVSLRPRDDLPITAACKLLTAPSSLLPRLQRFEVVRFG